MSGAMAFSEASVPTSPLMEQSEIMDVEFSSSPPLSSSLPSSFSNSSSPRIHGTMNSFIKVDWTLWNRQEWAKWPGLERYGGGQDTRAWWQEYGYRVEERSAPRHGNRLKWICADCFARGFKKKSDFCFVCSTGVAIKKHLRKAHGIVVRYVPFTSLCWRWS